MNEKEPRQKITDTELVDALIERINDSNPTLRDTYLKEAKRLLDLGEIKDLAAKEKLQKATLKK